MTLRFRRVMDSGRQVRWKATGHRLHTTMTLLPVPAALSQLAQ